MISLRLFFHQSATPFGGVRSALLLVGLMPVVMGKDPGRVREEAGLFGDLDQAMGLKNGAHYLPGKQWARSDHVLIFRESR
jgi:hypothetical protein